MRKEEQEREERALKVFTTRRWGAMNFISGGFLVGDKIEKKASKAEAAESALKEALVKEKGEGKEESKKRKRATDEGDTATTDSQPRLKRKKGTSDLKVAAVVQMVDDASVNEFKSKKKQKQKEAEEKLPESSTDVYATVTNSSITLSDEKAAKKRRKAEKRALKEAKRLKKAERRAEKEKAKSNATSTTSTAVPSREQSMPFSSAEEEVEKEQAQKIPPPPSNPVLSFAGGRHAVRQRYIRQKKMASMDPQAMKEVLRPLTSPHLTPTN